MNALRIAFFRRTTTSNVAAKQFIQPSLAKSDLAIKYLIETASDAGVSKKKCYPERKK